MKKRRALWIIILALLVLAGSATYALAEEPSEGCITFTSQQAFSIALSGAPKWDGTELSGLPVNAGTYTVKLDVEGSNAYMGVTGLSDDTWTFTIAPKEVPVTGDHSGIQISMIMALVSLAVMAAMAAGRKKVRS